jgi:hypothetical protein
MQTGTDPMRKKSKPALFVTLVLTVFTSLVGASKLPLFDAHIHYSHDLHAHVDVDAVHQR